MKSKLTKGNGLAGLVVAITASAFAAGCNNMFGNDEEHCRWIVPESQEVYENPKQGDTASVLQYSFANFMFDDGQVEFYNTFVSENEFAPTEGPKAIIESSSWETGDKKDPLWWHNNATQGLLNGEILAFDGNKVYREHFENFPMSGADAYARVEVMLDEQWSYAGLENENLTHLLPSYSCRENNMLPENGIKLEFFEEYPDK